MAIQTVFGSGAQYLLDTVNYTSAGTYKLALMSSVYQTHATSKHSHVFWSDCSASQITGQTWQSIGAVSLSKVTSDSKVYFKSATTQVTFASVGGSQPCGGVVVFRDTSVAGTSELIASLEWTASTTNGQNWVVSLNANGIASFTY